MNILVLKLILAPVIIGSASLAGRKWGSAVSGWLIGLPLTSGPVIFFLSLNHNLSFVMSSILGTLSGGFSLVAFCLTYAWLAQRFKWTVAIIGSMSAFAAVTLLMQTIIVPLWPLFLLVILAILLGMWLMPKQSDIVPAETKPGNWDIPVRILIGTGFILFLTEIASIIGPRLTGLLATIPLYTAILTVFAHRLQGTTGAINVLHGLLFGMLAFAGFFFTLGLLIEGAGVGTAFIAAIVITLLIQGITLQILPKKSS
ncbi:MAG TPA: hypothetical protein VK249_11585 [Anaerolineales bacterium]|nr:hypothetical protein [Anaerolineales bacterium]